MKKTLLVGEAPARGNDDQPAFTGRSGQFLTDLIGIPVLAAFDCRNLLERYPGAHESGKGARFNIAEARWSVAKIWDMAKTDTRVILAGKRVAKAFEVDSEYLVWTKWRLRGVPEFMSEIDLAILPHPSGVNRWWNDPDAKELARIFLLEELVRSGVVSERSHP